MAQLRRAINPPFMIAGFYCLQPSLNRADRDTKFDGRLGAIAVVISERLFHANSNQLDNRDPWYAIQFHCSLAPV
jgi:hypothetical protein